MDRLHLQKIDRTLALNNRVINPLSFVKRFNPSVLTLMFRPSTSRKEHNFGS